MGGPMPSFASGLIDCTACARTWAVECRRIANPSGESIVTGSATLEEPKDPGTCNVFAIYKLLATPAETAEMAGKYRAGGYGYGHAKVALLEKIKASFGPMRDKYFDLMKRPDELRAVILKGSERARGMARVKLEKLHQAVGVIGRPF